MEGKWFLILRNYCRRSSWYGETGEQWQMQANKISVDDFKNILDAKTEEKPAMLLLPADFIFQKLNILI